MAKQKSFIPLKEATPDQARDLDVGLMVTKRDLDNTPNTLPDLLRVRVDKVLESQPEAASDITEINSGKRLRARFGIKIDSEPARELGSLVKKHAGRRIG